MLRRIESSTKTTKSGDWEGRCLLHIEERGEILQCRIRRLIKKQLINMPKKLMMNRYSDDELPQKWNV